MEKKYECIVCDKEVREEEYETGIVRLCECQTELDADFDSNKWIESKEDEKIIGKTEKVIDEILKVMDADRETVEEQLKNKADYSQDMFDIVNKYSQLFIENELKNMDFYYLAQDQLYGVYSYLTVIVETMDSVIKRQCAKKYMMRKHECEKNNEKFVSAAADKEAELHVSAMNVYLSIFKGYLDSCKQGIQTCRRRIAYSEAERDYSK